MQYRRVGRSGLQVSAISIGGWLTFGDSVDRGSTEEIVRTAEESGINFIDLADAYGGGAAEEAIGAALSERRRSDWVISSKLFWPQSDNPNDRGLGRKHIRESVERSLRRLGTDYLDIYFCHREDPEVPLEETARAMDDLIRQGKILYWGTSVWQPRTLRACHSVAEKLRLDRPIVEQPRYNLLDRSIESGTAPTVRKLGMGLVVWSPLAGGILTGKYNDGVPAGSRAATTSWLEGDLTETNLSRTRQLAALARELSLEPSQLALAWVLSNDVVASAITGATRPEHVATNARAAALDLRTEILEKVDRIFR